MTANLITLTDPRSPVAEAFRTLRTNLIFSSLDRPLSAIAISSPAMEEDKSETAANLAVIMAQGGRSTILADCDLRHPRQHEIWGLEVERGLTTMVLEDEALESPPLVEVGVENLKVLPAGPLPPNPADMLGSKRMEAVIKALTERSDMVIFDTPPVLAVTDAVLLASRIDGLILVMQAGSTRRDHAERAKELLERVNVPVLGVVLTNAPADVSLGGYYKRRE